MSVFNTDPTDIDSVNEQMRQEAEEREAKQREIEQEHMAQLAARKKNADNDLTSSFQADAESGLKSLFGEDK